MLERCPSHVEEVFEKKKSFINLIVTKQNIQGVSNKCCVRKVSNTLTRRSAKVFLLYGVLHSAIILYHLFECFQLKMMQCSYTIVYHLILAKHGFQVPIKVKDNIKGKCVFC